MWRSGTWTAYWSYGREQGPPWYTGHSLELQFDGERVTGTGLDSVGTYRVKGWTFGDRLDISKRYIGAHEVIYQGRIGPYGCLVGHWMIGGSDGPGWFIWVPPGTAEATRAVEEWFGRILGDMMTDGEME